MQIAPGFEAANWKSLALDQPTSPDWEMAISVLDERIRERYILPADFLIASEQDAPAVTRRFGFTILAIDCLLVETLGAFLDGLEETTGRSRGTFCKFLTSRPSFSQSFTTPLAERFYKEFRCGILHQAEIAGNSKVWSVGPLIHTIDDSIIVNRNMFHDSIKVEFTSYLNELRNPLSTVLRANFRKKMNFIARVGRKSAAPSAA